MTPRKKKVSEDNNLWRKVEWIAELAEPYLRGYAPVREKGQGLEGFWFEAPTVEGGKRKKGEKRQKPAGQCRFFAGYLLRSEKYAYLNAETPECVVFVTLGKPGNELHQRLVAPGDSLLRTTHTYIGWLTHRPPRFAFFEDRFITMVRHRTMRDWPKEEHGHFSRNFFIETLAWLVRSGLVRKLGDASKGGQ